MITSFITLPRVSSLRSYLVTPCRSLWCPVPAHKRKYPVKKQLLINEYTDSVLRTPVVVIAQVPNLTELEWTTVRANLNPHGLRIKSISNGLFSVAAKRHSTVSAKLVPHLTGHNAAFYFIPNPSESTPLFTSHLDAQTVPTSTSTCSSSPVSSLVDPPTVKSLLDVAIKNKKIQIVAGVINGMYLDGAAISHFASLPTLSQLHSQLVSVLSSPAQRITSLLGQHQSHLVALLNQRVKDLSDQQVS